jgi:ribA/ribD-fused uncharacterized protein
MGDRFYFYSKSRDAKPGKGTNEYVHDSSVYEKLGKIKDWRKVLSNFHLYPFEYEGYTYNTIEHVFQAKKIELVDAEKALWFTLESGHEIGQGDGEVARKNRKLVTLNQDELREWGKIKDQIMFEAEVHKYKSCVLARHVLEETKNAELWHVVPRSKPIRFIHLEIIREKL